MTLVFTRPAIPADAARLGEIANSAYAIYVARMKRKPAPMLADYHAHIANDVVIVAGKNSEIFGYAILLLKEAVWQLENIAVDSRWQGQKIGYKLISECEKILLRKKVDTYQLYTNELMHENLIWYNNLGFREIGRKSEDGYRRVYLKKCIAG